RTGWCDTVMLKHAVRLNSLTEIALTKLDVLDTFDEVKVCVGYTIDGKKITQYPDTVERLARVEPEYVTVAGWKCSTEGITSFGDLPASARQLVEIIEREAGVPSARQLVEIIEREAGVPITHIGTGPARDAIVVRA
ncbi:MAG: adenylosuccinate synthetase, partial [Actinomycetota bacterium]